ncbi:MAG: glycosyltransferase family 1 protein [Alphaproteobacteria bacterium]|nr:glycosyltransferase family 1 protein [Alphaproteobacteria bacterium]
MKFLIVSDAWHPQINGVVRTYEHLVADLEKQGHQVQVVGPGDFSWTLPMPGYTEIRLAFFPQRRLAKIIDRSAADYIHIATEGPLGWAARKYCLRRGRKFTTSYHTHFPDYVAQRFAWLAPFLHDTAHRLGKIFVRHFHAPSETIMVATPSLEEKLKAWDFRTPMIRLSRGVDTDVFHPGEKNLFKNLKRPVALYVGRVAIEKNIGDFLEMQWPGSKVIVGDGPSLGSLRRRYPAAVFTGRKTGGELADHYRSADVFVFPSRTDTFGIVLLEALACGLPVAAYNVTGPKDIITLPSLGILSDSDLGSAALKALNCGTAAERAAHVKAHYTWEAVARQFENAAAV